MVYRVSVGTVDGIHITEHFSSCRAFYIYDISQEQEWITLVEVREGIANSSTECGCQGITTQGEISRIYDRIHDCHIVLVANMGNRMEKILTLQHKIPLMREGLVEDALLKIQKFYKKYIFIERSEQDGKR